MSAKHISLSFLLLAAAATAHADPVADFRTGTTVVVRKATVDFGGPFTSTNIGLAKRAGTLDFELQAADLGIAVPITVRLQASSVGGGRIRYSANQSYAPALDLGGGHWLSSVIGSVQVIALPLAGRDSTREGNVRLTSVGDSYVEARGDWGVLRIPIRNLAITGGVPQPPLEAFADAGKGLVCSDRVPTMRAFAVSLSGLAQGRGATILLGSTRGDGLMVPSGISVPKGSRALQFSARIAADFVGKARVTAAAGGVVRSLDIEIHSHGDCAR